MARNFAQVAQFLRQNFEGIEVEGGHYPPPPILEFLARILSILQLVGIAWMLVGGEKLLGWIGFRRMPRLYFVIQENPVPFAIFFFLVIPQIIQKSTATGAFEIYLGEEELFSRIKEGRFPDKMDLMRSLTAAGIVSRS